MEKRLILAIALSLLILSLWSAFVSKVYHIENKEVTANIPAATTASPPSQIISPPVSSSEQKIPDTSLFQHKEEKFDVVFIEPLAAIKEVIFKTHRDYKFSLDRGFLINEPTFLFKRESNSSAGVSFIYSDAEKKIIKKFTFSNINYTIELDIIIQNLSNAPLKIGLPIILGKLDLSPQNAQSRYQDVALANKDKILRFNARKNVQMPEIKFLSMRDRYFCAIIEPELNNATGFIKKVNSESEVGLVSQEILLAPNQQIGQKFHIYLGPQELKLINQIKPHWSAVIHFGAFDVISQVLLQLLYFLYGLAHNWGTAIIILSFIIYFTLYPLTLKQMRSMKEMQKLQPQIEELRQAHKNNPQKLNKEIMELYRQHKVNPMGGCLPLVLQMPIFFALYQTLMRSIALKGANFLWIKDLSEPDRLFILPTSLPVLGNEINILPIIMAIGMFAQQKISLPAANTASSEQQRLMMIIMPIIFGFIFYHMPAGLVLYWFINSALTLVYQWRANRIK